MRRTPALIGAGLLVVIVALFVLLSGGDDDNDETATQASATTSGETTATEQSPTEQEKPKPKPKPEPELPTIVIKGGEPVGGVQELEFTEGDDIRFKVESDVTDHVHIHGYNVFQDVEAGSTIEFNVPATITGVFEVELEDRVVPIAEITVNPS